MRSLVAALRNLVLPNGATSGRRIVLDSDNGVILVYDTNNNLIASIAPQLTTTEPWLEGISSYSYVVPNIGSFTQIWDGTIQFGTWNGEASFFRNGEIVCDDDGGDGGTLRLVSPVWSNDNKSLVMDLNSKSSTNAVPYMIVYPGDSGGGPADIWVSGWVYRGNQPFQIDVEKWNTFSPLSNGWHQDGGADTFSYKLDAMGWVHFRGGLLAGTKTDGTVIANVPSFYRPAHDTILNAAPNNAPGAMRIVVRAGTGNIEIYDIAATAAVGIHFSQVHYPVVNGAQ